MIRFARGRVDGADAVSITVHYNTFENASRVDLKSVYATYASTGEPVHSVSYSSFSKLAKSALNHSCIVDPGPGPKNNALMVALAVGLSVVVIGGVVVYTILHLRRRRQ